jgi:hypothetical protein
MNSIFRNFLNSFETSVKFCVVLVPLFKFCEDKVFRFISTFLKRQETAQNFEKNVLQICLRNTTFYTYLHLNPYDFL